MDRSFDFMRLLQMHKTKPSQYKSVKDGVKKRLDTNLKNRKSSRLSTYDNTRNLPIVSPVVTSEATQKQDRRLQLEKWKAEKERKKKEEAANKKKPFLIGVSGSAKTFGPPPPPPCKPSTSGRVTRSQTRAALVKPKGSPTKTVRSTFAPINASFKPPELKNFIKLPKIVPVSRKKTAMYTFDPVIPKAQTTIKRDQARPVFTATETRATTSVRPQFETRSTTRGKITKKPSPKKLSKQMLPSSSSGSDIQPKKVINRIKTPGARKALREPKAFAPKILVLESTSEDKSSDDSSAEKTRNKSSRMSIISVKSSISSSDIEEQKTVISTKSRKSITKNFGPQILSSGSSTENPSSDTEQNTIICTSSRKSLPKNFSPLTLSGESSSEKQSSDFEQSPVIKLLRKSLPHTPRNMVPKSESNSEEKLRSPKTLIDSMTPKQIETARNSPHVTHSRGKDNARKEMKWKIDEGLLDEDASDADKVDQFRQQLSSEIKRMTEMCDTWDKILAQTVLPDSVQEAVLSALGQARLLMSQKLRQFSSLVERCARPEPGTALVTPADLQGFWDMVFMQVENVDLRFKKLEKLRARNWIEDIPVEMKKKVVKPAVKKVTKSTGGPSRIRELIAAARKAKKDQENPQSPSLLPSDDEKVFEAGFFIVRSPQRFSGNCQSAPSTPIAKPTLLKAVLSSEAKKSASKSQTLHSTPFALLRNSQLMKLKCDGVAPLPQTPEMSPVNLFATPGRSILKSANSTSKSGKKLKAVLFDASDESLTTHNDIENDKDLAQPLNNNKINEVQEKENSPKYEPPQTRQQRKSLLNISNMEEVKTPRSTRRQTETEGKKSTKKTKEKDVSVENIQKTPRTRSSRRKQENQEKEISIVADPTPQRSSRRSRNRAIC